jgi:hypothetical protein
MNGVNSEKAKPSPRCGICNLILQQKQRQYCSVTCLRLGKDAGSLRPDVEVLKRDLQNTSYVKVGKKYGVSDNGVRYWVKRYIEEGKLTLSQADSTLSEGATTT